MTASRVIRAVAEHEVAGKILQQRLAVVCVAVGELSDENVRDLAVDEQMLLALGASVFRTVQAHLPLAFAEHRQPCWGVDANGDVSGRLKQRETFVFAGAEHGRHGGWVRRTGVQVT